ncbi:archease [Candidatus Uhrbacteria bacterium]|nr:archease [Candidatus Uhrbacteria bacterium]
MAYTIKRQKDNTIISVDAAKEIDAFLDAARGLYASMYDFEKIRGRTERVKIVVEGKSVEDLLRAWLQELLDRRSIHGIIYGSFSIVSIQKISNTQYLLTGSAHGEAHDPRLHPMINDPHLLPKSISYKGKDKKFSCSFQITH